MHYLLVNTCFDTAGGVCQCQCLNPISVRMLASMLKGKGPGVTKYVNIKNECTLSTCPFQQLLLPYLFFVCFCSVNISKGQWNQDITPETPKRFFTKRLYFAPWTFPSGALQAMHNHSTFFKSTRTVCDCQLLINCLLTVPLKPSYIWHLLCFIIFSPSIGYDDYMWWLQFTSMTYIQKY